MAHEPHVTTFDKVKKWADILDDIFSACRSLIPPFVIELVSPLLVGSLFGIIGGGEGYQAKKELGEIRTREEDDDRPLSPEQRAAEEKLEILVRQYIQVVSVVVVVLSLTLIASGVASLVNTTAIENDGVTDWLNHSEKAANIDAYNFIIVILVLSIYVARLLEKSQKLHHSRHMQDDPQSSTNISKAFGFQLVEVGAYSLVCIGIGAATGVMTGLIAKKLTTVSIGPLELDVTPGFILLVTGVAIGILSKNYFEPKYGPHELGGQSHSRRSESTKFTSGCVLTDNSTAGFFAKSSSELSRTNSTSLLLQVDDDPPEVTKDQNNETPAPT